MVVVNTPGRNACAVAAFAIDAITAETRNITRGHDALRRADATGDEPSELCVGVIGYGAIATRGVRLLRAFGARALVADPCVQHCAADAADSVRPVDRKTRLAEAQVAMLHARATAETADVIDADAFARMKPGVIFANTARGPMVDDAALTDAPERGHLRGVTLETVSVEPEPPDKRPLRLPTVTLTPHIAGASLKTVRIAAAEAAEEIRRHLSDEPPPNPC